MTSPSLRLLFLGQAPSGIRGPGRYWGLLPSQFLWVPYAEFVKEAFSLAVWAAAFLIAFQYSGALALQLESHIELPSARTALAFSGLFLVVFADRWVGDVSSG